MRDLSSASLRSSIGYSDFATQDRAKIQELEETLKVLQKAVIGLAKTETVEDAEGYFVLDEK